jgi:hypothetical protein
MSGCGQHRLLVILTTAGVRVYREKKSRSLFLISKPSKQQNHFECSEKNNMCTRLQDLVVLHGRVLKPQSHRIGVSPHLSRFAIRKNKLRRDFDGKSIGVCISPRLTIISIRTKTTQDEDDSSFEIE